MASIRRVLRFLIKGIIILAVAINLFILVSGNLYLYRAIYYTFFHLQAGPGIFDKEYFYTRDVQKGSAQPWALAGNYNKKKLSKEQHNQLKDLSTTSFLVLKNNQLIYEEYFDGFGQKEVSNSFSMAKSVISLLIGIAQQEGKITSIDDPVGKYLAGYDTGNRKKITIRHLLSMSSDMHWDESAWNPLSHNAEAYYGTDLDDIMSDVEYGALAGKTFDYKSGNTQVLGMILKKVTGKSVADYASEKIWSKIGAEDKAYWSLDHENGVEKAYCCLYATSRDFARLGKLMLDYGKWNGERIIDSAYVAQCVQPAKLSTTDGYENKRYGLSWWLVEHKGQQVFYARGIKGQYVICMPDEQIIIVRTGHWRGKKRPDDQPEDLFFLMDIALELTK